MTIRDRLRTITAEPVILCYVLPGVLGAIAMQHLYLEKACRVDLDFSEAVCDALAARNTTAYDKSDEAAVQKYVATMFSYKNAIQSIIPSVLLLFIGSWSDRHNRRKPWILLPLGCEILTVAFFWLTTYFFYELGVIYNVVTDGIAPVMTGGGFAFSMAIFAHISSISTPETRTVRIGAASTLMNVCYTMGSALSGVVYTELGFYGVYVISLVLYFLGLLYGILRLKEAPLSPDHVGEDDGKPVNFLRDFFNFQHVANTFKVAFKNGEKNRKIRIGAIMILVMVIIGPLHGEFVVMYLFVRYKFHWNEIDYSIFCTYYSIVHIVGTLFSLTIFSKLMKLDDAILGMISSMSKILASFIFAFAPNTYIFYLAVIVEMFNGTSFIAMRSIISKLVPPDELGKIYSLFGLCEALMPLLYGPLYSMIYKLSIDFLPGMFFIAGGLLTIPSVIMFFWLHWEHSNDALDARPQEVLLEKLSSTNNKPQLNGVPSD